MKCWEKWPRFAPDGPFFGRTLWNSSNWIKMTSIMDSSCSSEGSKRSVHCFSFFLNSTLWLRTPSNRWHQKPRHRCQHIGVCGAVSSYSGALSHYGAIRVWIYNTKSLEERANTLIKPQNHAEKTAQSKWFPMHSSVVTWESNAWPLTRSCLQFKDMHKQHLKYI